MNERSALPGLTKPDVPLSEAVYYFASKRYSRVGADFSARKLVELIRGCQLPATGIDADGSRRQIPPSDFVRCGVPPIGERYWGSSREWLVWANSTYGYSSSYGDAIERDRHVIWRNICVERAELVSLCGESGPSPPATIQKRARERPAGETTKRTGGRPPVVDWPLVQQEAHRLMEYHGDFKPCDPDWNVQAKLEELLLRYCSSTFGKEPSVSALRTRIPSWLDKWRLEKVSSGQKLGF